MIQPQDLSLYHFVHHVYVFGPNILPGKLLLKYPTILERHDLVEISNYARIALLFSSVQLQQNESLKVYAECHDRLSLGLSDPFRLMNEMFRVLSNSLYLFKSLSYPDDYLDMLAKDWSYSHAYVVCVVCNWLYEKLVSDDDNREDFVINVNEAILEFNEKYRITESDDDVIPAASQGCLKSGFLRLFNYFKAK